MDVTATTFGPRPPEFERTVAADALAWLAYDVHARAIVDDDLSIRWINALGTALLDRGAGLEIRGGALFATEPAFQQRLWDLVRGSGRRVSSCSLSRRDGHDRILVRAQALDASESRTTGLVMIDAGPDFRADYQDLDVAFGLTVAEHRVLLRLLGGVEADALAQLLGVSVETVRSHIRNIYTKLDVGSRERLFFKAQPFRL
jgi:DNA-binding CsgD family transcriptional regulator